MRRSRLLLLSLCALAVAAPAASAADDARWLGAQQFGPTLTWSDSLGEGESYVGPEAAMGRSGHAILTWDHSRWLPGGECCASRVQFVDRAPGGDWSTIRELPGTAGDQDYARDVEVAANGAAAILFGVRPHVGAFEEAAHVSLRSPSGAWGQPIPVPGLFPQIAIADNGRVAAAWIDGKRVKVGFSGSGFAPHVAVTVDPEQNIKFFELISDGNGDLVLGLTVEDTRIVIGEGRFEEWATAAFVATRPLGGSWSEAERLGPWTTGALQALAVNRKGDAAVTWTDQDGMHLARRPAGQAFGAGEPVDAEERFPDVFRRTLAVDEDGHVSVLADKFRSAAVRSAPFDAPLGPPVPVGDDDALLDHADLVSLRGGGALLVGQADGPDEDTNADHMRSFIRPAAGEPFAEIPYTGGVPHDQVVAGDGSDRAVVLWTEHLPVDFDHSTASIHSVVFEAPAARDDDPGLPPSGGGGGTGGGGGASGGGGSQGGGPLVPVRVGSDTIRLRLPRGVLVGRRGAVRLRLVFDTPLSGLLRVSDVFDRTLAKRSFTARAGVPVRMRLRVPGWVVRRLRRGRLGASISLRVTTASGRQLAVKSPTTLRRG